MPQLFPRRSNAIAKLCLLLIFVGPTASFLAFTYYKWSPFETEVDMALLQPVPFSHKHHVGELDIDCRYCHSFVEDTPFAGMPPSQTCMTCHSQIWREAPMLKPDVTALRTARPSRGIRFIAYPTMS